MPSVRKESCVHEHKHIGFFFEAFLKNIFSETGFVQVHGIN